MPLGYSRDMQPAMIPESFIEERRRLGHDKFDEVWDGVLHMVPHPSSIHQALEDRLRDALKPIALRRSLLLFTNLGILNPSVPAFKDYRVPDFVMVRREAISRGGIEGPAELAVEMRSPDDESYEKLPYYAKMGVREVWIIDQQLRTIDIYNGTQRLEPIDGVIHASALGLELRVNGNLLNIKDGADMYDVDISETI